MIQRAKEGRLVSGQGATCKQLDAIIAVDKDALEFEKNKLKELLVTRRSHLSHSALHMVHRGWCSR